MKPKEIQELLDFIAQSGLAEVNIETDQFKLAVRKYAESHTKYVEAPIHPIQQIVSPQPIITNPVSTSTNTVATPQEKSQEKPQPKETTASDKNLITIKSPMIGTFYRSSNPETPPFVNVGDEIKPGKPVCIIEAMKLFNEIESEVSGRVVKILVENASPVEYDQPLFLVEPK